MEIVNISYLHLCSYGINRCMINNNWYWWTTTAFIIRSYGRYRNHWSSVGYISNQIVVLIFVKIIVVLKYHIIVSIWKPVTFCYSNKKYINRAERNQHSKVELLIISYSINIKVNRIANNNWKGEKVKQSWQKLYNILINTRLNSKPSLVWEKKKHIKIMVQWPLNHRLKILCDW